ncbi:MAG: hypothetical protein U0800_14280 [Isosphaeraceae bacterium]
MLLALMATRGSNSSKVDVVTEYPIRDVVQVERGPDIAIIRRAQVLDHDLSRAIATRSARGRAASFEAWKANGRVFRRAFSVPRSARLRMLEIIVRP